MNFIRCLVITAAIVSMVLMASGASSYEKMHPGVDGKRELFVALYPYIPDANNDSFKGMCSLIKTGFEKNHPDINLTVVVSSKYDTYNLSNIPEVFSRTGPSVVGVDLLMLKYLADGGYIKPLSYDDPNVLIPAKNATVINNTIYALPTWICSEFLYTSGKAIPNTNDPGKAGVVLQGTAQRGKAKLAGDFQGDGTLPWLYLDGYVDNYGYGSMNNAFNTTVDERTIGTMTSVMDGCTVDGVNKCLDNDYHDNDEAQAAFARGDAMSFIGFSENVHQILKDSKGQKKFSITSARFGYEDNPLIWVDGFVLNSNNSDAQTREDAIEFYKYLTFPTTLHWIAFSKDASDKKTPPRYMLPANAIFYSLGDVRKDPYYPQFIAALKNFKGIRSFPNDVPPGVSSGMYYNIICKHIQGNINCTVCN